MGIGGYLPDYIFGNNSVGGYHVSAVGANGIIVTKATLGSDDTIYCLIHEFDVSFTGVAVKAVVYSDDSGYPDSLLAVGTEVTSIHIGWNAFPLSSSLFLSAGTYWLGIISDTALSNCCNASFVVDGAVIASDTYADGPSDPFVVGGTLNFYARPVYASGELIPVLESGKIISHLVLDPPEGVSVRKIVSYAVLDEPKTNIPQVSIIV